MVKTDRKKSMITRAAAPLLLIVLVTAGFSVTGTQSDSETLEVCPSGCDHSSIQDAIDAANADDTIMVGAGTYTEAIVVPQGKSGLVIAAEAEQAAEIVLPSPNDAATVHSADVTLYGFTITQSDDATAVVAAADGLVLRENHITGALATDDAAGSIDVDARLNHWDTDEWADILPRLISTSGSVAASPFRLADGGQLPPAPSVAPSGHCDSLGFEPRFIEEAFWCAHAGSTIVLHKSEDLENQIVPPAYVPSSFDATAPGNLIDHNRDLNSVDPVTGVPDWAPGFSTEPLTGLILCSGGEKASDGSAPEPTPGGDCENDPDGVVVDAGQVVGATPLPSTLDVRADDVTISGLTIKYTTETPDRHALDVRGNGILVEGNEILGNFLPHEHDGGATTNQIGVFMRGGDFHVEDNEIANWRNIGLYVSAGAGADGGISDNLLRQSRWHGILLEGPTSGAMLGLRGNTIEEHGHSAIRFGVDDTSGFEIRRNVLSLSNLNAVTVQDGVQDATLDVRGNDWQLYKHDLLPSRVDDESGTNTVQQVPFVDAEGDYEPPRVRQIPPGATTPYPRFFGIQDAIDHPDTVAGTKIHVPGGKYTPWQEAVVVDKEAIEVCGQRSNINPCLIGEAPLQQPVVKGIGAPAFHIQADDVTVRGFQAVSDSGTGILVSGDDAHLEDLTVRVAGPDPIVGIDGDGATNGLSVQRSRVLPATDEAGIIGEDGIRGRFHDSVFEDNEIAGFASGIRLRPYGDNNEVRGNLLYLLNTGVVVWSENTQIERNGFLSVNMGVDVAAIATAGQSADGTVIHENDLASTATGLRLRTDNTLVDAVCNDWGTYTAGGVENKINDQGNGNIVEFLPFISPDGSSPGPFECLTLPTANFTFDPETPLRNEEVTFTDTSEEGSNSMVQREWNFGDGTNTTQFAPFTGDTVTHAYTTSGTHLVTLKVTDSQGAHRFAVNPLTVVSPAPMISGESDHVSPVGALMSLNFTAYDPQGVGDVTLDAALVGGSALPTGAQLVKDAQQDHWRLEWTPSAAQAGTYIIELTATNEQGLQQTHLLDLQITADEVPERTIDLTVNTASPQGVAPGDTVTLQATLKNVGDAPVEVFMNATAQGHWIATVDEAAIALNANEFVLVPVQVEVGQNTTNSRVTASAHVMGAPEASRQVAWLLEAPLEVGITMQETTTGSDIVGVVQVAFTDGTPASGVDVTGVRTNGFDTTGFLQSSFSGQTNETGELLFSFPAGDRAAQLPGSHFVDVEAISGSKDYRGHVAYQVDPPLI